MSTSDEDPTLPDSVLPDSAMASGSDAGAAPDVAGAILP